MFDNLRHRNKGDERAILLIACVMFFALGVFVILEHGKGEEGENAGMSRTSRQGVYNDGSARNRDKTTDETEEYIDESALALHTFDPNTVDSLTLLRFGVKPYQIKVFMKYRNSGAVFRYPESIENIYTWDDEIIDRLLPYVRIDEKYRSNGKNHRNHRDVYKEEYADSRNHHDYNIKGEAERTDTIQRRKYSATNKFTTKTVVDVNTADSATLIRIPGIGAGMIRSILNKRQKLGGFYSVSQLREIEYLNENPEIIEWFEVKSPDVTKININKATFNTLRKHPYIGYECAQEIIGYRRVYGDIKSVDHLRQTEIFTNVQIDKVIHYIEF